MTDLAMTTHGDGTPVLLVHGSLATGEEEWEAQHPLAAQGFRLLIIDRRGYGNSPSAQGEDFVRDADDLASLMHEGAHLVGHSYGGLATMFAAAQHPSSTRSLALLEPPAFTLAQDDPAARALLARVRGAWDKDLPDREWMMAFLAAVGSDPGELPPEILDAALPLVPVMRRGRPTWDVELPLAELSSATFPKLVVSGGHDAGFEAICDELASQIGASRAVVEGAGHEIQLTGEPINEKLLSLWRSHTAP